MPDPITTVPDAPNPQIAGPRGHVIVVGSLARSRRPAAEALRARGYQVSESPTAADAATRLASAPAAVIVFDVVLPSVDGWEFRQAQRQFPVLRTVPTILLSPVLGADAATLLPRAVFTIYKPCGDDELAAVIDHYSAVSSQPSANDPLRAVRQPGR